MVDYLSISINNITISMIIVVWTINLWFWSLESIFMRWCMYKMNQYECLCGYPCLSYFLKKLIFVVDLHKGGHNFAWLKKDGLISLLESYILVNREYYKMDKGIFLGYLDTCKDYKLYKTRTSIEKNSSILDSITN